MHGMEHGVRAALLAAASVEAQPVAIATWFGDWLTVGGPAPRRYPPPGVDDARASLARALAGQLELRERIALLGRGLLEVPADLSASLPTLAATVEGNLAAIEAAAAGCFEGLGDLSAARVDACVAGATAEGLAERGFDASLEFEALVLPGPM